MAFDYKSFTTGFLNQVSKGILERAEERKAYTDKYEEEYDEAKKIFNNRKDLVAQDMRLYSKGKFLGASDEMLKAAHAAGKGGLLKFVGAMEKQSALLGGRKLATTEAGALIEGEDLFEEGDVEEFFERSRNLMSLEEDTKELTDNRNVFQRMFAVDPKGTAKSRLGADKMRTIELARQDAYESLAPEGAGVFLTLEQADVDVYDSLKTNEQFFKELEGVEKLVSRTPAFKAAIGEGEQNKIILDAQTQVMQKYIGLYGQEFIQGLPKGIVPDELLVSAEAELDDQKQTVIGKAVVKALNEDLGQRIVQNTDNGTIEYIGLPDGSISGDIKYTYTDSETGKLRTDIIEGNAEQLKDFKKLGFNFDVLSGRNVLNNVAEQDVTGEALGRPDTDTMTAEELAYAKVDMLSERNALDTIVEQDVTVDDPLLDSDIRVELKDLKEEFEAANEEEKEALVPKVREAVQSAETVGLFESDEFKFLRDEVKEFFTGRRESLSEVREKVKEDKEAEVEPVEDITVKAIERFGGQNFSITEDNQVYINDRRTGKPKTLITQKEITEPLLEQVNKRTQDQLKFFFDFAKEKGFVNDKNRLLSEWKRYAEKNLLSDFFTNTVISNIQDTFGQ
tara:strand:- start:141 stop:2003 length:1863 start_codon:yes stop_codon:yes gene_type:complete